MAGCPLTQASLLDHISLDALTEAFVPDLVEAGQHRDVRNLGGRRVGGWKCVSWRVEGGQARVQELRGVCGGGGRRWCSQ